MKKLIAGMVEPPRPLPASVGSDPGRPLGKLQLDPKQQYLPKQLSYEPLEKIDRQLLYLPSQIFYTSHFSS